MAHMGLFKTTTSARIPGRLHPLWHLSTQIQRSDSGPVGRPLAGMTSTSYPSRCARGRSSKARGGRALRHPFSRAGVRSPFSPRQLRALGGVHRLQRRRFRFGVDAIKWFGAGAVWLVAGVATWLRTSGHSGRGSCATACVCFATSPSAALLRSNWRCGRGAGQLRDRGLEGVSSRDNDSTTMGDAALALI